MGRRKMTLETDEFDDSEEEEWWKEDESSDDSEEMDREQDIEEPVARPGAARIVAPVAPTTVQAARIGF